MKKLYLIFTITMAASAMNVSLYAAPPDVGAIQRGQQQLMDDETRSRELEAVAAQSPFATGVVAPAAATISEKPSGRCVEIKQIAFAGNTILSDTRVRKITAIYEGRCLTVDEINAMLNDITNEYIGRGYATSRAFMQMPQLRLKDGILDIRIIEGTIGKIDGVESGERATAFPGLRGDILNIRDIEQGLDQMNRLGSNKASMDIKAAPEQDGTSDIEIKNELKGRSNIGATIDNFGTDSTGQWRGGLLWTEDNLLGLEDIEDFQRNWLFQGTARRVSQPKEPEGIRSEVYVDSEGYLTIGIGNNVDTLDKFLALDLRDENGEPLTPVQKEAVYNAMLVEAAKMKTNGDNKNSKTNTIDVSKLDDIGFSSISISQDAINKDLQKNLENTNRELQNKFSDFNSYPTGVQKALTDMLFNMGGCVFQASPAICNGKQTTGWPNLFAAIEKQDWAAAAKESKRPQLGANRNTTVYNWFANSTN